MGRAYYIEFAPNSVLHAVHMFYNPKINTLLLKSSSNYVLNRLKLKKTSIWITFLCNLLFLQCLAKICLATQYPYEITCVRIHAHMQAPLLLRMVIQVFSPRVITCLGSFHFIKNYF